MLVRGVSDTSMEVLCFMRIAKEFHRKSSVQAVQPGTGKT